MQIPSPQAAIENHARNDSASASTLNSNRTEPFTTSPRMNKMDFDGRNQNGSLVRDMHHEVTAWKWQEGEMLLFSSGNHERLARTPFRDLQEVLGG